MHRRDRTARRMSMACSSRDPRQVRSIYRLIGDRFSTAEAGGVFKGFPFNNAGIINSVVRDGLDKSFNTRLNDLKSVGLCFMVHALVALIRARGRVHRRRDWNRSEIAHIH